MSQSPNWIEIDYELVELTEKQIKVMIKPKVVETLKNLTRNNGSLYRAVLTLLQWFNSMTISTSDIVDVTVEPVPITPGSPEQAKVILKVRYFGGHRLMEMYLSHNDSNRLASEIKKLRKSKF